MSPLGWFRRRLARRLAVVIGCLGLLTSASVGWFAHREATEQVYAAVDDELDRRVESLRIISTVGLQRLTATADLPAAPPLSLIDETAGFALLLDSGRAVIEVGQDVAVPVDELDSAIESGEAVRSTVVSGGATHRVLTVPLDEDETPADGIVAAQFTQDISPSVSALDALAVRLVVAVLIGSAVVAVVGWIVGARLAGPLERLTTAAERVARDEDARPIDLRRVDETGRLAESFNSMLSSLELSREQQRRLVADASHQLRTPLTSLRMRTELLLRDDELTDEQRRLLSGSLSDAALLTDLTSDLVDLAAAITPDEEPIETIVLGELVEEVVAAQSAATGRTIPVHHDGVEVAVRPAMVRHAVRNLVENALKYAPDAPVEVAVEGAAVEVHDGGPGIDPADRAVVFERFFRSPEVRSRPGNGIGLAIVREVAVSHGGTTWVKESSLGGAAVGCSFAETRGRRRPAALQGTLSFESGTTHLNR